MAKIERGFYLRENVLDITQELIGKYLFTNIDDQVVGGKIVETEAYSGKNDKACHAHAGKRTRRTEIFYGEGGLAYVYLCYGIHNLFNIITNKKDNPDAVLVRAIEPSVGIETMMARRRMIKPNYTLTAGPGCVSQALGINKLHYGEDLTGDVIWIEDRGLTLNKSDIRTGPRVGVQYAGEDALLPWRFSLKGNKWVSKAK